MANQENNTQQQDLNQLLKVRREKLQELQANGKNPFDVTGQMLHAARLSFKHPITNEQMNLEAPLPKYFLEILQKLDNE